MTRRWKTDDNSLGNKNNTHILVFKEFNIYCVHIGKYHIHIQKKLKISYKIVILC